MTGADDRAAMRAELAQVAWWPRRLGVGAAVVGAALAVAREAGVAALAGVSDFALYAILGLGAGLMGVGVGWRTAWHRRYLAASRTPTAP